MSWQIYPPGGLIRMGGGQGGMGIVSSLSPQGVVYPNPQGYVALAGGYISMADANPLDITGDLDVRCKVSLNDWTPTTPTNLIGKYLGTGNQRSWRLFVTSAGVLTFTRSTDGAAGTVVSYAATVNPAPADATSLDIRVTYVAATGVVTFYTGAGLGTQLGATVAGTAGNIFSGSALLELGTREGGTAEFLVGRYFTAQVRAGIDGTLVADFDARKVNGSGYTDTVGTAGGTWVVH